MMITLELDTVDLAQIAASGQCFRMAPLEDGDRKSTRLNSSHAT